MDWTFDTSVPLARRRELAALRMVPLAARLRGRVVEQADRLSVEATTASGRAYRVVAIIDDDLPPRCGFTGGVSLEVSLDNRVGAIHLYNVDPDQPPPSTPVTHLRGRLHVSAEEPEARQAMLAAAAQMPLDFIAAVEALFAPERSVAIDIGTAAIVEQLAVLDHDDELWAWSLEHLEDTVRALDRIATVVEHATPGRTAPCAFCGARFVVLADQACPRCGGAIS